MESLLLLAVLGIVTRLVVAYRRYRRRNRSLAARKRDYYPQWGDWC